MKYQAARVCEIFIYAKPFIQNKKPDLITRFFRAADYYIAGLQAVQRKQTPSNMGERHLDYDDARTELLKEIKS